MGNLNDILSFMYRMDKGYKKAVNLNENSQAYFLVEDKREKQARSRSLGELQKIFADDQLSEEQLLEKLKGFESKFYHDPKMRSSSIMRLEPLFCRIAFGELGYGTDNAQTKSLLFLEGLINYLFKKRNEIDLVNVLPNDSLYKLAIDDLYEMFEEDIIKDNDVEYQEINNTKYTPKGYEIVGPLTFEDANYYGNESCPGGELCYTQDEDTWNDYTNNGENVAYVALENDWEDYEAEHNYHFVSPYDSTQTVTNNSPYDPYGLSMIFVFVGPYGELTTCNTRWNHDADYPEDVQVDHALTRKQVSEIIGINFFQAFKNKNDRRKMVAAAIEKFKNGDESSFEEIIKFGDSSFIVKMFGKYNVLTNGRLVSNIWFDTITEKDFSPLLMVCVSLGGTNKINFINENGELLFKIPIEDWFVHTCRINSNYILVNKINKCNIINNNGSFLFNTWLDYINRTFTDDYTKWDVRLNGKYNIFNFDTMQFIWNKPSTEWLDGLITYGNRNFAGIKKDKKYNLITYDGKLLWDKPFEEWFDKMSQIFFMSHAWVRIGNKQNYFTPDGKLLWDKPLEEWFDEIKMLNENVFKCVLQGKITFINGLGEFIVDGWLDYIKDFIYGYAKVGLDGKCNFINKKGKLLLDKWFDDAELFYISRLSLLGARVCLNGKWNLVVDNEYKCDMWYDTMGEFSHGFARVSTANGTKFNYINTRGEILWKKPIEDWFDAAGWYFDCDGYTLIEYRGEKHLYCCETPTTYYDEHF